MVFTIGRVSFAVWNSVMLMPLSGHNTCTWLEGLSQWYVVQSYSRTGTVTNGVGGRGFFPSDSRVSGRINY